MKLANALSERGDLQSRLSELQIRLNNNSKVQEGEAPAEQPEALFDELNIILTRLEELIKKINLTNSKTTVNGISITEQLAHRDCLKERLRIMRQFLNNASDIVDRYSPKEIKIQPTVSVAKLQKEVDKISEELRQTDESIQELNWTTELME